MSNSVVPAAAAAQAKHLVNNKKLTKHAEDHKPARDEHEQKAADHEVESAKAVQTEEAQEHAASMSDISLSGDFSFSGALADAAEGTAALVAEGGSSAQDDGGSSSDGGGVSSTVLLVGAVGLVGAGIAVAASGGGSKNEAPTIDSATQAVTTDEDTPASVTVAATDPDNDTLSYSVSTAAAHGTVTGGTGGAFTYTPNEDYNGSDSFVVTATDPKGEKVTQTVNVTINPVNDAPKPDADNTSSLTVDEDTSGAFTISFTDPEGNDPIAAAIVTGPAHGVVVDNVYTPNANYNGSDSITYSVSDSTGASTTFTLDITVNPVNDDPVATDASVATAAGTPVDGAVTATDVDGDALQFALGDAATNGTAAVANDGTFTYTPNDGFAGADSFTVTVSDGNGGTDTATVSVNVGVAAESIDVGSPATAVTLQAGAGDFIFSDDATATTNVVIQGFGAGDSIEVSGVAALDAYNFSTGSGAAGADDLRIEYTDSASGNSNIILIEDVLNGGVVFNYATAVNSVGFDFMSIA